MKLSDNWAVVLVIFIAVSGCTVNNAVRMHYEHSATPTSQH